MEKQNAPKGANGNVDLAVESTFGNFDYTLGVSIPQAVLVEAGNKGLLWEVQRSPAGAAEFAITKFDGKTPATTKPEGWSRTDIPFTTANAEVIRKALSDRANYAAKSFLPEKAEIRVTVTEHKSTVAEPKYSKERAYCAMTIQFDGIAALEKIAKRAGYTGKVSVSDENNFELFSKIAEYRNAARKSL